VPPAVITLTFDPVVRLSDTWSVRVETLALAAVLFVGMLLAVRIGSVTPAFGRGRGAPGLRPDDLAFIVVGAVPGAIVGGRLGYVLDHVDYYSANPGAIADPAQGAMTLTLAVPLGILTGGVIARLIGAPVARWLHAVSLPLLFVLAGGKLAQALGGGGQGAPSDVPWATAYAGPGPWASLAPALPSHPSQVYEAVLVTIALLLLIAMARFGVVARRDGGAMFLALALWAIARIAVGFTWRDPVAAGPLGTEQALAVVVLAIALAGLVQRWRAPARAADPERSLDVEARPA
jgi:phosphatidylglycerol:prolipoprotein diacylglycerol transferase